MNFKAATSPQKIERKKWFIYNSNITRNGRNMIYGKHVSKHAYLVSYINYSHDEDKSCSTFEIYIVCETCAHFSFFFNACTKWTPMDQYID